MENNDKIIEIGINKEKGNKLKRQAKMIGDMIILNTTILMEDKRTHAIAVGIGLMQGLKYRGSFKNGVKAGLATYGALIAAQTIQNVVQERDEIKKA